MSLERKLVQRHGRWAVVTIDDHAVQVTVPAPGGTRYAVNGYGDSSIAAAASYAVQHGKSWPSREAAIEALLDDGWSVSPDNVVDT
jgi:hypothetical protein